MAVYAFDGTWNIRDRKDAILRVQPSQYGADASFRRDTEESNTHRFCEFAGSERCEYLQGVGTRFWLIGRLIGGAFGIGARYRVRKMYRRLCERYATDTDIDIIGFSRGAATAVHFANVVHEYGVRSPQRRHLAWHWDPLLGLSWRLPKADAATDIRQPPIRFLGVWDTVASIGLPIGPLRNRPTKRWRVATIPGSVLRSFHAMALDEVRATFALVRPERADGDVDRHYELWFRGVHSNVGGGYADRGLSDIALAWMMEMYLWTLDKECERPSIAPRFLEALRRLQPAAPLRTGAQGEQVSAASTAESEIAADGNLETLEPNPDGEIGRPKDIRRQAWRAMPPNALIHHAAYRRTRNLLLDHHRANRRLLRPIPGDARPVYDPPYFYARTLREEAEAIALEAFYQVPVRASEWLTVKGRPIIRSDDWVSEGRSRNEVTDAHTRQVFVLIATEWLLNGGCAVEALPLPARISTYNNNDADPRDTAQWVIDVLTALNPYVPALRDYQARPRSGQSASAAAAGAPDAAWPGRRP